MTIPGIRSLFIPPGPGDESVSIGAAYCLIREKLGKKIKISNLLNPYVGTKFNLNTFKKELKKEV